MSVLTSLRRRITCSVEEKKDLSSLTTLGVGGSAEYFLEPGDMRDVCGLFSFCLTSKIPLYILGGGTNTVFADGEIEGVVLSTRQLNKAWWEEKGDGMSLSAEAGYLLPRVVSDTLREGLGGAEFAVGIPGTLGGALAGNAGAGGKSLGDFLEEVTTVEPDGSMKKWRRGEFEYAYRRFSLSAPGRLIAECRMRFSYASRPEIERTAERFRAARSFQPHGARSAGCAFKNPPEDSAGRLLDICGCKGLAVGGAVVSDDHANFILNRGGATGEDIRKLMEKCRDIVFQKTGVRLDPEVRLTGFSE